eukprot:170957-Chlamydomonas_euryale.AAC.1
MAGEAVAAPVGSAAALVSHHVLWRAHARHRALLHQVDCQPKVGELYVIARRQQDVFQLDVCTVGGGRCEQLKSLE